MPRKRTSVRMTNAACRAFNTFIVIMAQGQANLARDSLFATRFLPVDIQTFIIVHSVGNESRKRSSTCDGLRTLPSANSIEILGYM